MYKVMNGSNVIYPYSVGNYCGGCTCFPMYTLLLGALGLSLIIIIFIILDLYVVAFGLVMELGVVC